MVVPSSNPHSAIGGTQPDIGLTRQVRLTWKRGEQYKPLRVRPDWPFGSLGPAAAHVIHTREQCASGP